MTWQLLVGQKLIRGDQMYYFLIPLVPQRLLWQPLIGQNFSLKIALRAAVSKTQQINQIHSQLLVHNFINNPDHVSKFAASIALKHPQHITYSLQILNQCHIPTVFALNSFIRVFSKSLNPEKCFSFYKTILNTNQNLDNYTFTFLIKCCVKLKQHLGGLSVHGVVIKYGYENDPHVLSGLISMHVELGFLNGLKCLFMGIGEVDLVSQTAMVVGCAKLCDIGFARKLFDEMPVRDVVAWNAMITGYVQCGEEVKGLELFGEMEMMGLKVNESSMMAVLSACTRLGALDTGRWAHKYIESKRLRVVVMLGSALVDMYAKCGDIKMAMDVFSGMEERNVYTWSSAMRGLAMNGYGEKCVKLFSVMQQEGLKPNDVTFTSVLKGCSIARLVEEGRKFFGMIKEYRIEAQAEHYGCMVDLYGQIGRLDEALNVIYSMPFTTHAGAWGALLKASKLYNNVEMAELASKKIVELEAKNDGAYVELSNVYAHYNEWDSVDGVRHKTKSKRVIKGPGVSVIKTHA